jgi:hypothetical protein
MSLNSGNEQDLTDCVVILSEAKLGYLHDQQIGEKRKRCRICSVIGHNEHNCPFIPKTQDSYIQQYRSNIKERLCSPIVK